MPTTRAFSDSAHLADSLAHFRFFFFFFFVDSLLPSLTLLSWASLSAPAWRRERAARALLTAAAQCSAVFPRGQCGRLLLRDAPDSWVPVSHGFWLWGKGYSGSSKTGSVAPATASRSEAFW
jgi:hypothetical protein